MRPILLLCFLIHLTHTLNAKEVSIIEYGAVANDEKLDTEAIQKAIDKVSQDGEGKVIIPKGKFISGSIILKSNVELVLRKGAELIGSLDIKDYIIINRWKGLIMADQSENIKISGKGIVNGRGAELALSIDSLFYIGKLDSADYTFPEMRPRVTLRPQIIEMVSCKNVNISGITLKNAAGWVQSYYMCKSLFINKIKVESDAYWNNDGIDIIDCQNVSITNSYFNSSDDGICIKSYGREQHGTPICENIIVDNCKVRSSASAVKLGTASFGGFRNIKISRIKVFDTFRSAIALESYGKGFLENVVVDGVKAKNTGNALFIRLGQRSQRMSPGILKDVTIRNMKVQIPFGPADLDYQIRGPELPFFHNTFPASITGLPQQSAENIHLENIQISYPGRGNKAFAYSPLSRLDEIPENAEDYPEFSMFGELPAWGLYVRHVNGISFKNITLKARNSDYRPAIVFDDVKEIEINNLKIQAKKKLKEEVIYHNSSSK